MNAGLRVYTFPGHVLEYGLLMCQAVCVASRGANEHARWLIWADRHYESVYPFAEDPWADVEGGLVKADVPPLELLQFVGPLDASGVVAAVDAARTALHAFLDLVSESGLERVGTNLLAGTRATKNPADAIAVAAGMVAEAYAWAAEERTTTVRELFVFDGLDDYVFHGLLRGWSGEVPAEEP